MTGILRKILASAGFLRSRIFAVAVLTVVLAFTVYHATSMTQTVRIREGNDVQTYYTMEDNPERILKRYGYNTMAYDAVDFTGFYDKLGEISISRAFPVQVVCDGEESVHMVTEGTGSDVLETAEIDLGDQDLVDLPMDRIVGENDTITVTRQERITRTEEIELPFETVITASPEMAPGTEEVLEEGEPGLLVQTYSRMVVDGVEEAESFLGEDTVKEPVDRIVEVGFPARPVSSFDFEWQFDEEGEPIGYQNVLRGQRAAGYSAPAGARTASGRAAIVGNVAVNPNVIPYGSKLYIQSTDGSFVYGYAVAADTGTALTQGVIAVDLFYDSYAASAGNGIKYVDIFVLE